MRLGFPGWRRVWQPFALGAAMAMGQAPLGWWFVTLPALALLLRLMPGFWLGGAAGAGYFAVALNWIVFPFFVDAAQDGWMAPFALVLMALGGGLFWAAACWAGRRAGLLGLVAAFGVAELARGYILTGFPWALIGHVWIDTPVAQVAAWMGPTGLSLITLCLAALLALWRPVPVSAAVAVLAGLWAWGTWQLAQPLPPAPGVMLRLVQPNIAQELKWDAAKAQDNFTTLMRATASPPNSGSGKVDLVIWPETALPYLVIDNPDLPAMIGAAANGAAVAVGMQRVEGMRGWNSVQVFGPMGEVLGSYDKHHLVPFGEYIPFGDALFDWMGIEAFASSMGRAYSAGPGPVVLDLGRLGHVMPLICYEAVFPQDLRGETRPDWLMQVTNDAWFGTLTGPYQHAAQARLRAVEQGLPLVRVANTGVTEVVDARGRVTASLPFGTEGVLDAALPGALPATPYARWGEIPVLLWLAGLFMTLLVKSRRPLA